MICKKCGTQNAGENKYCTNCGDELVKENQMQKNICGSCGSENNPTNKFCIECGEKLRTHGSVNAERTRYDYMNRKKEKRMKNQNKTYSFSETKTKNARMVIGIRPLLIAIGVLFLAITVIAFMNNWLYKGEDAQYPPESKSSNPVVEAGVFDIASKFVCSCGSCGEQSLEKCKCVRAVEERQFMRDYLERKNKPEDIVVALADKYGFLKAEYAKEFKVDGSKTWSSTKLRSF